MIKQTISLASHGRQIEKVTDSMGQVSYLIKQGSRYIGKTANGGYKSAQAALDRANS